MKAIQFALMLCTSSLHASAATYLIRPDGGGCRLPSGHYVYRLRAGDEVLAGRMTMLK